MIVRAVPQVDGSSSLHASDEPPVSPPGWEREHHRLVRIAAPDGRAVAWLAPEYGANCIGYAVRGTQGWVHVFQVDEPATLAVRPTRSGCAMLFPFPGHVRDAQYWWEGIHYTLPLNTPGQQQYTHGFAQYQQWHVEKLVGDAATLRFSTDTIANMRASYPFAIRLELELTLDSTSLRFRLTAINDGARTAPVGLGFHPYFAPQFFGSDRTMIRVMLPGRLDHRLVDTVPTGERVVTRLHEYVVPAVGELLQLARTDLGADPVAQLRSVASAAQLDIALFGCEHVVLYAPDDRPALALEPHSCAPGAASQPIGHRDGLVGLEPGHSLQIAMVISPAGLSSAPS